MSSENNPRQLPPEWVDRIFDKLTLVYGDAFLRRWSDVEIPNVKADWALELAGFIEHPGALTYALRHLPPGRAPDVLQFREIARMAPPEEKPALPAPEAKADPQRLAELLKRTQRTGPSDGKEWARRIVARHKAGRHVSPTPLRMAREALGIREEETQ